MSLAVLSEGLSPLVCGILFSLLSDAGCCVLFPFDFVSYLLLIRPVSNRATVWSGCSANQIAGASSEVGCWHHILSFR